ncbi:MAG: rhomboid family intramembrane serine protease [Nanoarchaeota archaeon]|nr:rhomboid family intramembrane serine protease [Nanoarchaeota archaeon]
MSYDGFTELFILNKGDLLNAPYSLVSHMFLHANFSHLLFNMFGVLIFGSLLELKLKDRQYYLLYFGSGLIAGIVGSFIYTAALGASAGVMALVGASAYLFPNVIFYLLGVIPMKLRTLAIIYFIYDLIGSFYLSNVASEAHIIGMFSGILFGYLYYTKKLTKANPLSNIQRVEAHIQGSKKNSPQRVVVVENNSASNNGNNSKKNKSKISSEDFSKKVYVTADESSEYLNSNK